MKKQITQPICAILITHFVTVGMFTPLAFAADVDPGKVVGYGGAGTTALVAGLSFRQARKKLKEQKHWDMEQNRITNSSVADFEATDRALDRQIALDQEGLKKATEEFNILERRVTPKSVVLHQQTDSQRLDVSQEGRHRPSLEAQETLRESDTIESLGRLSPEALKRAKKIEKLQLNLTRLRSEKRVNIAKWTDTLDFVKKGRKGPNLTESGFEDLAHSRSLLLKAEAASQRANTSAFGHTMLGVFGGMMGLIGFGAYGTSLSEAYELKKVSQNQNKANSDAQIAGATASVAAANRSGSAN